MGNVLPLPSNGSQSENFEEFHKILTVIQNELLHDLSTKQQTIHELFDRANLLELVVAQRDKKIEELNADLEASRRITEGNRQLVNKLLNDIDRLQQEIEWYKRTYENRSLLGTLKEKVFGR